MARKSNAAKSATADPPFAPPNWPAAQVEMWKLDKIKPYPNNPRTHPPEQIKLLARSMAESGVTMPILVDEAGVIIAGHGRLMAAQENAFEEYPVVVARGWTETQKRAERMRDNQIGLLSGWDEYALRLEVGELKLECVDLSGLGFSDDDLGALFAPEKTLGMTDPDDLPKITKDIFIKGGDLWELGKHKIICGDATSKKDVDFITGGCCIDAVITDPPYGVGIEYASFDDTEKNVETIISKWMPLVKQFPVIALTPGHRMLWSYPKPSWIMAWIHPAGNGRGPWGFTTFNPILVYGKDPYLANGLGSRADSIVLAADRDGLEGHPVAKPVAVWKWLIERMTIKAGSLIFDPFNGAGTSIIAAEMSARICLSIEIDPAYVQLTIERWQNFTGKQATLDGKTFEQVAKERSNARPKRKPASMGPARAGNGLSAGGLAAAAKS